MSQKQNKCKMIFCPGWRVVSPRNPEGSGTAQVFAAPASARCRKINFLPALFSLTACNKTCLLPQGSHA